MPRVFLDVYSTGTGATRTMGKAGITSRRNSESHRTLDAIITALEAV